MNLRNIEGMNDSVGQKPLVNFGMHRSRLISRQVLESSIALLSVKKVFTESTEEWVISNGASHDSYFRSTRDTSRTNYFHGH